MGQPESPQCQAERPTLAVTAHCLLLQRPLQALSRREPSRPRHPFPPHVEIQQNCLQYASARPPETFAAATVDQRPPFVHRVGQLIWFPTEQICVSTH